MPILYRPGTAADNRALFTLLRAALADLGQRANIVTVEQLDDAESSERAWQRRRGLFEHLTRTGDQFWVAERDGQLVGYARAIHRDGMQELTELMVLPGEQSVGVGGELLARTFPNNGARRRIIIASPDIRAQARYLKAGVYPYAVSRTFVRQAEAVRLATDLTFEPMSPNPATLDVLADLDHAALGFRRDEDHRWLMSGGQGMLVRRSGQSVGYGYLGETSGPFLLLDPRDFPAVLARAETRIATVGGEAAFEVPLHNRHAVDYLLRRGYRLDPVLTSLMSDTALPALDRYIATSPPFFL